MDPRLGRILQGSSTIVAKNGKLDEKSLRRLKISREEFTAGLRRQGLELSDTERVIIEPEGVFNATPKPRPSLSDVMAKLNEIEAKLSSA